MKPRVPAAASAVPPRRLVWPSVDEWLDPEEVERALAERTACGFSETLYEAQRRVRSARLDWTAQTFPGLPERELAAKMRAVFARDVSGRSDLPPRPALLSWDRRPGMYS